ncbi:MAG: hypothetical protein ABGX16_14995 [Pirellulales bacterium]
MNHRLAKLTVLQYGVPMAVALAVAEVARIAFPTEPDQAQVPGVVIQHAPASSGIYVGSPGIAILPSCHLAIWRIFSQI